MDVETSALAAGGWRALTVSREKFDHYAGDAAFRHGWAAVCEVLGDQRMALLQRLAMVVIQPDGLAAGCADRCLDYLEEASFTPLAMRTLHLDASRFREMWRYQSNVATYESLVLGELVCTKTDSVMLLLWDGTPEPDLPASVRLTALKGHSDPARRHPAQLRSVIGALNWVFVMVHGSDEPIDVVRELAVMMDSDELAQLLAGVRDRPAEQPARAARAELSRSIDRIPGHRLSISRAVADLRRRIARQGTAVPAPAAAQRAQAALVAACNGDRLDWRTWSRDLQTLRIDLAGWDVLLVAAEHIQHERAGVVRLIEGGAGVDAWRDRAYGRVSAGATGT
jgi:nucleoside diphosphate kinase